MKQAGQSAKAKPHVYKIWIDHDPEVNRWYVSDCEYQGLGLEDDDPIRLIDRLRVAARDLIELNNERADEAERVSPNDVDLLPIFNRGIDVGIAP